MQHTSTATPSDEPLLARGRRAACLGAVLLVSMLAFEAMAVAAVMPAIADDLGGDGQYALAFGGLLAASVVGMVLAGWITTPGAATQRARPAWLRGARAASVLGMAVFGAGLLLAGMAPQMGVLVAGRVLQGLGSGDPCTDEDFFADSCRSFFGHALAVIRPTEPGEITVTVAAEGCPAVEKTITVK
ncbi:MAG: hypothetical protein IIZ92_05840 [Aquincola sp.]|nr:hypothetical protein [Aquincola sp.]